VRRRLADASAARRGSLAAMAGRDAIVAFLDDLLDAPGWPDYGPNGLQVPGAQEVRCVVTGVSAHAELFVRAAAAGAQLVLCHHGMLWDKAPRTITPAQKRRLQALFESDLSLVAYHLPLDAHPEVGNNALICAALGLKRAEPFADHRGRPLGWVGRTGAPGIPATELVARCARAFGRDPLAFAEGPAAVHSVGVVSGGGAGSLGEAVARGLDAFVTGEPSEPAMADAREGGVHFVAGGHYATEIFGVRRLGELLAERFGVEHRFVDIPNPV
jgi:dinuclear metal center YbgI/SA1388 family protein